MKKISQIALATTLAAASASASAWWGGPFTSVADDFFGTFFGEGNFSFNMNVNARAHGRGHAYGYNRYYHAPYAYVPIAPPASAPAAQK